MKTILTASLISLSLLASCSMREEVQPKAGPTTIAGDWQFTGTSTNGEFTISDVEGTFYVTKGEFTVNTDTTTPIEQEVKIEDYISLVGSVKNLSGFSKKVALSLVDFKLSNDYNIITVAKYSYSIEGLISRDVDKPILLIRK